MKKDYTEAGYIEDAITRIALVNKNIAIKLISNGKTIVQTNGNGDLNTAIYSIFGKDVSSEINIIDYEYDGIKVTGAVGKPVIARGNRANQLFFLNGRYIKDKNLTAAADQAYKGMIPVGRYGFLVLNLEMDPKLVDVNVHPAKLEVRFEDENKVFKAVYHTIKTSLAQSELVENVEKEETIKSSVYTNFGSNKVDFNKNYNNSENKTVAKEIATPSFPEYPSSNNTDENNIYHEEKKTGIAGLFSKIIKEKDETEEELNNNHLEEIFKYRQGLANNSNTFTSNEDKNDNENFSNYTSSSNKDKIQKYIDDYHKSINEEEINKKVSLGNTVISSNTKELDVGNVNNMIKEATAKVDFSKLSEKQITQVVNSNKEEIGRTQIININENKEISQDTVIANSDLNSLPQNTIIVDEENNNEISQTPNYNISSENEKNGYSVLAENLVSTKLGFDNTQMIDTTKVREAMKEENFKSTPEFAEMYKKTFGVDPFSVRKEKELEQKEKEKINASNEFSYASENVSVFEDNDQFTEIPYKFIGIVFNTYIIIELKDEMYIIDQHAAHERILYENVKENYYNADVKDEQFLLMPDVISLTHKEMTIAKENVNMFARAGFTFEEFGDNTIKLMSVPSMCEDLNTKQLFLDILDEIDTVAVTARQEKEDKFIATVACKAAVKAKMKLDDQEVKALMKKLLQLPNPFTCPHGRPTAIKMTKYDLERKFSRR